MNKTLSKILTGVLVLLMLTSQAQSVLVNGLSRENGYTISLVTNNTAATLLIDKNDYETVKLAAEFFSEDVARVSGVKLQIDSGAISKGDVVIVGTIEKNQLIRQMIANGKIKYINKIKGQWEASLWQIVANPVPGIKKAIVVVGSDRRGAAYGLMQLSKKIGVSPWYWWADMPVRHQSVLKLSLPSPSWDKPAVKYRGIFINDEDWGMNQWARKTFETELGSIGPKTYERVFELMMRLRLNYIWPAMHEVTKEFGSIPENWKLADKYGIVAGSSHCEPMLYNNVHWNEKTMGRWNYSLNKDSIYRVWQQTTMRRKDAEAVWTMGIRGIHDRGMESPPFDVQNRINLLETVFKDQRELLDKYVNKQWGQIAQCFVPYKEVLPVYDAGLKVPDDVTLIWVDDNFGYIRRLSNLLERKRSGGAGLYWHLSYYGGPHSYTWINTTAPALMWEEFHKAWENDARKMWVINVGDIKPMELGIEYFSRLAWDAPKEGADAQPRFLNAFLSANFPKELLTPLCDLLTRFYRLGTVRKPELMNRDWALSLSDPAAEQLSAQYRQLAGLEEKINKMIPGNLRDTYTELIGFPIRVLTASGLIFMHDRAAVYNIGNSVDTAEITRLRIFIDRQVDNYNNELAGGKWKWMMPGAVTSKNLPGWNSQVAWPWGETRKPDTAKRHKWPVWVESAVPPSVFNNKGKAGWQMVYGLGPGGRALSLQPASLSSTWAIDDISAPTVNYTFQSKGEPLHACIAFLPTFRVYPGMRLRVAVGVDGNLLSTVEVPGSNGLEDENGVNRNQGIRNNIVRATVDIPSLPFGTHRLFIRAVDPGVVIDNVAISK